jgi:hypothetical protein
MRATSGLIKFLLVFKGGIVALAFSKLYRSKGRPVRWGGLYRPDENRDRLWTICPVENKKILSSLDLLVLLDQAKSTKTIKDSFVLFSMNWQKMSLVAQW